MLFRSSSGALIATGKLTVASLLQQATPFVIVLTALVVVVAHAGFLYWIQTKLHKARDYLSEAQDEMRTLLGTSTQPREERRIWRQWSMYVELVITALLVSVLVVVLNYSGV